MRISDWSSDVCSSDLCLCPDFRDRLSDLAGCWWVKPRRGKSYPQGGLVLIYGLKSRVTGFWRLRKILNIIVKSAIFWPWASTEPRIRCIQNPESASTKPRIVGERH